MRKLVCDLCNEPWDGVSPAWTYVTINTVDGPDAPGPPGFWCEDPEWLVCQPCHEFIQAGDKRRLWQRSVMCQGLNPRGSGAKHIFDIQKNFWIHRSANPPKPENTIEIEVIE